MAYNIRFLCPSLYLLVPAITFVRAKLYILFVELLVALKAPVVGFLLLYSFGISFLAVFLDITPTAYFVLVGFVQWLLAAFAFCGLVVKPAGSTQLAVVECPPRYIALTFLASTRWGHGFLALMPSNPLYCQNW